MTAEGTLQEGESVRFEGGEDGVFHVHFRNYLTRYVNGLCNL